MGMRLFQVILFLQNGMGMRMVWAPITVYSLVPGPLLLVQLLWSYAIVAL